MAKSTKKVEAPKSTTSKTAATKANAAKSEKPAAKKAVPPAEPDPIVETQDDGGKISDVDNPTGLPEPSVETEKNAEEYGTPALMPTADQVEIMKESYEGEKPQATAPKHPTEMSDEERAEIRTEGQNEIYDRQNHIKWESKSDQKVAAQITDFVFGYDKASFQKSVKGASKGEISKFIEIAEKLKLGEYINSKTLEDLK